MGPILRYVRCLLLACLVISGGKFSRALAENASEFGAAIQHAVTEYESGNWAEAHTLFARAHELKPSARTWRGLGLASFELRHYLDAIAELTAALADTRKPLSAAQRSEVEEVLARAEQFVAIYHVTLDPPDAELRIEGQPMRLQDGQLRFDPGEYALSARAPGYEEYRTMLRPEAGARATLPISLARVPVQTETAAPLVRPGPEPVAPRSLPREPTGNRAMVWTGAATLAVGVAADVWSWYAFSVRRARAETLVDASDDDYEQARQTWTDARAPLIGATVTGAALTTTGVELLVLGAPNERLPWWLAGVSAATGAGLAAWASIDIVQGKCSNDDARLCAMQAQYRERGTLVLVMSAPLFALPLTKLIRSARGAARDADVQVAALAGGLAVRGRW